MAGAARAGAAVAVCPRTPLRGLLQPTDFTMVDIGEPAGPETYVLDGAQKSGPVRNSLRLLGLVCNASSGRSRGSRSAFVREFKGMESGALNRLKLARSNRRTRQARSANQLPSKRSRET